MTTVDPDLGAWRITLEDLAAHPDISDWDYNDFYWNVTVGIDATVPNSAPVALANSVATSRNMAITIDALSNDFDPDGHALTILSVGTADHGTVTRAPDGNSVVYTPTTDYVGEDTFTYVVDDGHGGTATGSVFVAVNYTPLSAANDFAATTQGMAIPIRVTANDEVPSGTPTTVLVTGAPAHGTTWVDSAGIVTYLPDSAFVGTDTFTYTLTDALGETAVGAVTVVVNGSSSVGEITGLVWDDDNEDGVLTPGEAMTPGVAVKLYKGDEFVLIATATTDAAGSYHLPTAGLAFGEYRLQFTDPAGRDVFTPRGDNWTDPIPLMPNAFFEVKAQRQPVKAPPTPFTTILREKLDAKPGDGGWDIGGLGGELIRDGLLVEREIDMLMKRIGNQEIKASTAAALAQLKGSFEALGKLDNGRPFRGGVTLKMIREYERLNALQFPNVPFADAKKWLIVRATEAGFEARKAQLTEALTTTDVVKNQQPKRQQGIDWFEIGAVGGLADLTKVAQGKVGDCSLIATTISMLSSNAAGGNAVRPTVRIGRDAAKAGTDEEYIVRFMGGRQEILIAKPTQSQLALYAKAGDNGLVARDSGEGIRQGAGESWGQPPLRRLPVESFLAGRLQVDGCGGIPVGHHAEHDRAETGRLLSDGDERLD